MRLDNNNKTSTRSTFVKTARQQWMATTVSTTLSWLHSKLWICVKPKCENCKFVLTLRKQDYSSLTWAKSRSCNESVWFLVSNKLSSASMKSATIVLWELSGFLEREETAAICGLATSLTSFGVLFWSSDLVLELVSNVLTKVFEALGPIGGL